MDTPQVPIFAAKVAERDGLSSDEVIFIDLLKALDLHTWKARVEEGNIFKGCIHLSHIDHGVVVFSPMTAVYHSLTGNIIHRGSFFCQEMCTEFGLPWWTAVKINYATTKCGSTYSKILRNAILETLGMSSEKS